MEDFQASVRCIKSFIGGLIFKEKLIKLDIFINLFKEIANEKKNLGKAFLNIEKYKDKDNQPLFCPQNNIIKKIITFIEEEYAIPENQGTIIILLEILKGILEDSDKEMQVKIKYISF